MKKLVIANQKGGVGKTTTVNCLSSLLPGEVLVIDSDLQCNTTDTFHAEYEGVQTMYDLLFEDEYDDVVQTTDIGDIIASDPLLREADDKLKNQAGGEFVLSEKLEKFENDYDWCIIDTAPSLNKLLLSCLLAADYLVIPVTADRYALQGLSQLFNTLDLLKKRYHKDLKIAGFLLVKNNDKTKLSKEITSLLNEISEKYNTKVFTRSIRECIKVREAQAKREMLLSYAPYCTAALDYKAFVEELLEVCDGR